jgi:hypothetical protein
VIYRDFVAALGKAPPTGRARSRQARRIVGLTATTAPTPFWIPFPRLARLPPQRLSANFEVLLPLHDVGRSPRYAPSADSHWLWKRARFHPAVDRRDIERRHLLKRMLVE